MLKRLIKGSKSPFRGFEFLHHCGRTQHLQPCILMPPHHHHHHHTQYPCMRASGLPGVSYRPPEPPERPGGLHRGAAADEAGGRRVGLRGGQGKAEDAAVAPRGASDRALGDLGELV